MSCDDSRTQLVTVPPVTYDMLLEVTVTAVTHDVLLEATVTIVTHDMYIEVTVTAVTHDMLLEPHLQFVIESRMRVACCSVLLSNACWSSDETCASIGDKNHSFACMALQLPLRSRVRKPATALPGLLIRDF